MPEQPMSTEEQIKYAIHFMTQVKDYSEYLAQRLGRNAGRQHQVRLQTLTGVAGIIAAAFLANPLVGGAVVLAAFLGGHHVGRSRDEVIAARFARFTKILLGIQYRNLGELPQGLFSDMFNEQERMAIVTAYDKVGGLRGNPNSSDERSQMMGIIFSLYEELRNDEKFGNLLLFLENALIQENRTVRFTEILLGAQHRNLNEIAREHIFLQKFNEQERTAITIAYDKVGRLRERPNSTAERHGMIEIIANLYRELLQNVDVRENFKNLLLLLEHTLAQENLNQNGRNLTQLRVRNEF